MSFRTTSLSAALMLCCVPATVLAQGTTFRDVANTFVNTVIGSMIGLFVAVAIVGFFYGIVTYLVGAREGDKEKINKGNTFIMWGLVSLLIMSSVWGIIYLFQDFFGITSTNNTILIPKPK